MWREWSTESAVSLFGISEDKIKFALFGATARIVGRLTLTADFHNAQGVIFVVDSSDEDRILEARHELSVLLKADELRHAVLLVYANKQDLPAAMSAVDITSRLGLDGIRNRDWYVQGTCGISGEGLVDGHPDSIEIC